MTADIKIETASYEDATIGRLWCEGFQCFTLELPWLDNQTNISCIPEGVYEYEKRISPSKGYEVIELKGVEGRTYIQIHAGNYTRQIRGCTLVGNSLLYLDRDNIPDVANSMNTHKRLMKVAPHKGTVEFIRR